jgi:hypothetical protein
VRIAYILMALAVVLMGALVARRVAGWRGESDSTASRFVMADAFGLGGLSSLAGGSLDAVPSPVEHNQIVAYYGSPRTPSMGILGQHEPEDVADLLAARAARVDAVNGAEEVVPALHLVFAVAQPQATGADSNLQYVDDRTVRQFIALARRRGFALILDLQIGNSRPLDEVKRIEKYLLEPDVQVALDPEFALAGGVKPGDAIGSIDASDIEAVQSYLATLSAEHNLPKKLLVVHQFQPGMITSAETLTRRTDVDLLIDMDGYGPADIKEVKYKRYGAASYAPFGGIKVFLQHDPDPLTEEQLVALNPRPAMIIYQ